MGAQAAPEAAVEGDKVAAVSRAVSDALKAIDAAEYLRPLVTARTTLGDIHGALQLVKDAKEAQLARKEAFQMNGTAEAAPSTPAGAAPPAASCSNPAAMQVPSNSQLLHGVQLWHRELTGDVVAVLHRRPGRNACWPRERCGAGGGWGSGVVAQARFTRRTDT